MKYFLFSSFLTLPVSPLSVCVNELTLTLCFRGRITPGVFALWAHAPSSSPVHHHLLFKAEEVLRSNPDCCMNCSSVVHLLMLRSHVLLFLNSLIPLLSRIHSFKNLEMFVESILWKRNMWAYLLTWPWNSLENNQSLNRCDLTIDIKPV